MSAYKTDIYYFGDKKNKGKKTGGEKNVADDKAIFVKKIFVWI